MPSSAASVAASAQDVEQIGVEVGDAGIPVIEHGHAIGEDAVGLGDGTVASVAVARTDRRR